MRSATPALVAVAALSAVLPARAAELSGRATTTFRLFDLKQPHLPAAGTRTYRPLDQALRLAVDEMGARKSWRVDAYLRGRLDLATDRAGGSDDFDVVFAHATWTSRRELLEVRVGRQLAVSGFGWHGFDGVRLAFPRSRRARFFVFAGLPVSAFENDAPDLDDFTYGAGATASLPGNGSLGVEYELRRFEDATTDEWAGLDLAFRLGETQLAANADYSVLHDRFGETAALVRHVVRQRHVVEGRFTRVAPIFPADSIWAVFAIHPHDELRLSYELHGGRLAAGGYVAKEDLAAGDFPGTEGIRRAAATLSWRGKRRSAKHRGEIGWQSGFSGDRLALRADSDLDVAPRIRAGGGVSVGRYDNAFRLTEEDEQVALRGRVAYDHFGRWELAAEVEQFFGRDRDTLRGMLVFDAKLGRARRERPWWGGRWGDAWGGGVEPRSGDDDGPAVADVPADPTREPRSPEEGAAGAGAEGDPQ